jgi:site-specific recombinase XerC
MVIGQIMPVNPAAAVRGPRHIVRRGKTPVLDPAEARQLIDAINTSTIIGLRDRALIGLMVYSFARIGAALGMRVEDVYQQNRRLWVRLHEKGGKQHAMPCHRNLETYLHEYLAMHVAAASVLTGMPRMTLRLRVRYRTWKLRALCWALRRLRAGQRRPKVMRVEYQKCP